MGALILEMKMMDVHHMGEIGEVNENISEVHQHVFMLPQLPDFLCCSSMAHEHLKLWQ